MDQTSQNLQERPQGDNEATVRADREYRSSEEWRAICEARYVLAKPFSQRRVYLDGVGKERGAAAREYLERVIREEWKKKAPAKGG